jgi:hypothetical protein
MSNMTYLTHMPTHKESNMTEVTVAQAALILSANKRTIARRVEDRTLPARRQGIKHIAYISLEDLRAFAQQYGYRFNEKLAEELAIK